MTGNSSQRRKALRAKERLSKRAMSEGRYPWLESALAQPEKPAEAEKAISAAPALRSGGKPPKEVIPDTPKPIAPPEPRGEAEGALVENELEFKCGLCGQVMTKVRPGKYQCDNPDCLEEFGIELGTYGKAKPFEMTKDKKRPLLWRIWRGLRKLVGR